MSRIIVFVFMITLSLFSDTEGKEHGEPFCTSTFDFEKKLLENMVRLEHTVLLLKENVDKKLTELTEQREEITAFRERLANEQTELKARMKNEQNAFVAQTKIQLNDERKELEASLKTFATSKETIVFSARGAKSDVIAGTPVFGSIFVNEGGAYDVTSGKFTCPVAGIYSFSFSTRSFSSSYTYCYIRLNGKNQDYAISTGINNMASITIHLKLEVKDVVDIGGCGQWEKSDKTGVSFSGSLEFRP